MQFDKDSNGKNAEIFFKLREILLGFQNIKEIKNEKQTSYSDDYAIVAMMRDRGDMFVFALGKGAVLQEKYPFLKGEGKIVRHMYFSDISDVNEDLIREIIEETMILNMEAYEIKKLKKQL